MSLVILATVFLGAGDLPYAATGSEPAAFPHFPDRVHTFVWRNWPLVPVERLAEVIGATPEQVRRTGEAMGLPPQPDIPIDWQPRAYVTILRRNWHLLPDGQMMQLLGWSREQLAYTLREDDFLYSKLGVRPACPPLRYVEPSDEVRAREAEIAAVVKENLAKAPEQAAEPLFGFDARLSEGAATPQPSAYNDNRFSLRLCYSYGATYGDALLDPKLDPYPDGYLARLSELGVNAVWLHAVLYKLAPFPWDDSLSANYEERLENLQALVARARRHGISIYLYLNEPRAMPLAFFEKHPELKGVEEGGYADLCTSVPAVQDYVRNAVKSVFSAVPDLEGAFTITVGENRTVCWSHFRGAECPRCGQRSPQEVVAEINAIIREGMVQAGSKAKLVVWDWIWPEDWIPGVVEKLPPDVSLMSVSEWGMPIQRGGVEVKVGEYSLSTIGPGDRARRAWSLARQRGLGTVAKIQAGNSWELSTVPYIPAVANVAEHVAKLRDSEVDGLMLSWTLGGYPSPSLEVVSELGRPERPSARQAMESVAARRFGAALAPAVVRAWTECSVALREFPFHQHVLYLSPIQAGAANLLWGQPTGYRASMVGFPYDDLDRWRGPYPAPVLAEQLTRMADGFDRAAAGLREAGANAKPEEPYATALADELTVAEACAIQYRSTANQVRFVEARRALTQAPTTAEAQPVLDSIERVLRNELELGRRLYAIQTHDSRIGFEATNQYLFIPQDLAEKVLNCRDLLERWLPSERAKNAWAPGWQ